MLVRTNRPRLPCCHVQSVVFGRREPKWPSSTLRCVKAKKVLDQTNISRRKSPGTFRVWDLRYTGKIIYTTEFWSFAYVGGGWKKVNEKRIFAHSYSWHFFDGNHYKKNRLDFFVHGYGWLLSQIKYFCQHNLRKSQGATISFVGCKKVTM